MLVFLTLNHIELSYTQEELVDLFMGIASGTADYSDTLKWVMKHL